MSGMSGLLIVPNEVRGNNRRLVGRLAQTGAACKPGSGLGFTRVQGILHIGFGLDLARLLATESAMLAHLPNARL